MVFGSWWRKLILTAHVVTSVGFLGSVAGFLALAVVGATTGDSHVGPAAYIGMGIITWDVIVPLAVLSIIIGLVQSLGTPWGLLRYYWVIIKEILTVIAFVVLMLRTPTIDALSRAAAAGGLDLGAMQQDRFSMVIHGAGGLAVLLVVVVLSVYKPRGVTPYGAGAITAASG